MSTKQILLDLSKKIHSIIDSYTKKSIQRMRKIDLHDAFSFECLYSNNYISQEKVCSKINSYNYDKSKMSCVKSYIKRCEQIPINMVNEIQDLLSINQRESKKIIKYAVDGSHINLSKRLSHNEYSLNQNKDTSNGYIMGIFNISRNSPEMITLNKSRDERKAISEFITKSDKRYENSLLVFDRGYYSSLMERTLNDNKIKFVFRLKECFKMIPLELKKQTSGESISKESNRRIIKYVIGQKYFYILTNLMDQNDYPIEMLIQTYHQRWEIEEYFSINRSL